MRVSQGVPQGRKIELYHPELFDDNEEVIVYNRDEFRRTFFLVREQLDYLMKMDLGFDRDNEWKLMGQWPVIMERIHILGSGLNPFYSDKPSQAYLDTYLNEEVKAENQVNVKSVVEEAENSWGVSWL